MSKKNIYISYAEKDKDYKEEFVEHLSPLIFSNLIEELNSNSILPGENWRDEIRKQIDEADLYIFLLSSSFFASGYLNDMEVQRALKISRKENKMIIPVLLREVDYSSLELSNFQALPRNSKPVANWDNRDKAWTSIVKEIKEIVTGLPKGSVTKPVLSKSKKGSDVKEIQTLISMGKIKKAMDLLEEILTESNSDSINDLILLKARLSSLERESRIGIISSSDHNLGLNRIIHSILTLTENELK